MKRHRRDYELMSDMNLTNLLDTAFVLLIAFILASPTMRPNGLNVNLPDVSRPGDIKTQAENKVLTISIQKKKDLPDQPEWVYASVESIDQQVDLTDGPNSLDQFLKAQLMLDPKLQVVLQSDKTVTYDTVAKVLAVLTNHGLSSVGLPLNPLEEAPKPPPVKKPGT